MRGRSPISAEEMRGREAVRRAAQEAREEAERKFQLGLPHVQKDNAEFYASTDGVHHSGVKIKVHPHDHKRIIKKEKRIQEMEALGFGQDIIDFAQRDLDAKRTYLRAASYRGPTHLVVEDHHEEAEKEEKEGKLRSWFGRSRKKEKAEIEVVTNE